MLTAKQQLAVHTIAQARGLSTDDIQPAAALADIGVDTIEKRDQLLDAVATACGIEIDPEAGWAVGFVYQLLDLVEPNEAG